MTEHLLTGIALILVLGISAQWLAWKLRLPSILMLLLFGFFAGPITHLLDPDEVLGDLLFPVVSISVAIILFEGGLSLKRSEIRTTGHVVRNLVSVGALVTWAIAVAGAIYILELSFPLALLFGAILVVTGPTVIIPLLRHVRAVGPVSSIAKWEGIVNDPIGAILAVLVFEGIIAVEFQAATATIIISLLQTVLVGVLLAMAGAYGLAFMLRRYWVPDYLQAAVALMVAVGAFALSNIVQKEAGLVTVTLMGIILTNQKGLNIKPIIEFKENLGLLLLSALFIILSARLDLAELAHIGPRSLLFLVLLVLVARPASVLAATAGSGLKWGEKVFLMWMAPRGIVAAAVTSVFALELAEEAGMAEAELLVPEIFLVIVGTVTIYGLSAAPLGRWLGVAQPNPQGNLIVGAHHWARLVGRALQQEGFKVLLIDANHENVTAARLAGLPAVYGNVLSENIHHDLELGAFGRLLALTPNDEINALATLHFAEVFGRANVFQLHPKESETSLQEVVPLPLRGRLLFSTDVTCDRLTRRFEGGATVKRTPLTERFGLRDFQAMYGPSAIPLFLIDENHVLHVFSAENRPTPRAGHVLISLVDPEADRPDSVFDRSPVLTPAD
ncbi:MAG: sodium:proton antiporter [Anaerolineae bacterium]